MSLIPDWKQAHRLWSMRWTLITVFLSSCGAAYALLPDDWMPAIPPWVKATLALATVFSAGAVGVSRLLQQAPKDPPQP